MTPRIYLDWREAVRVFCAECGHEGLLDLQDLITRGLGDRRIQELRYRCRATRMVPDGPGLFTCGGTRVRFIIQPHSEHRRK
jgi:hypothetical protein